MLYSIVVEILLHLIFSLYPEGRELGQEGNRGDKLFKMEERKVDETKILAGGEKNKLTLMPFTKFVKEKSWYRKRSSRRRKTLAPSLKGYLGVRKT